MLVLQIIFTVLSALCLVAILPAGTFGGMPYFFVCAGGAGLFFALTLLCKKIREKKQPQQPEPDFLHQDANADNANTHTDKK